MLTTIDSEKSCHMPWLQHFPVALFASVMGLCGLSLAWAKAELVFALGFAPSGALLGLTTVWFVLLTGLYLLKVVRHPAEVLSELRHPVKLAFVPGFSIGLILLSVGYLPLAPQLSLWLWSAGALIHLALTVFVVSSWVNHTHYEVAHLNPAWFIPVVGNIMVPIAGVQHAPPEISWFFFSLGWFFWPVLSAILLYRLIFHPALPAALRPTLFIFMAPPALGCISWLALNGSVDAFARFQHSVAVGFAFLLVGQDHRFLRIPFALSWWAYSFPMAALTIASLLMANASDWPVYAWLAKALLGLTSMLVLMLVWRTACAAWRGEVCVPGS